MLAVITTTTVMIYNNFLLLLDKMIQVSLVEPHLSFPLHNTESHIPKSEHWLPTIITAAEYYSCYISGNNNSTLSESQLQQLTPGPVVGKYTLIVRYVAVE